MNEMMSEIDVWKLFHDHIHDEIEKDKNETINPEEDEKTLKRNRELSMYQNTPTVKTTTTTTRKTLPDDWNPPGNE